MSHEFQAIYEHGVLRPLTPLNLPESVEVVGTLHVTSSEKESTSNSCTENLRRQQSALNAMFEEVDRLPQSPRKDGLSGRDHDQILYGSPK